MNSKVCVMGVVVLLMVCVAVVTSDRLPAYYYQSQESSEESYESREAQYNFQWAVRDDYSRNDFGHQEGRDDDNTQGSYYVQLPDGRRQTVTYYVDGDDGYIADVKYSGEARYPDSFESFESYESPRRYAPPRPVYG